MKSLILAIFFCATAHAQNIPISGPFSGLNDSDSSITLNPGEAQDTLNVEVSQDSLALKKRKGYVLESTLEVSTSPITGQVYFKSPEGGNVRLMAHDIFVDVSSNGAVFTHLLTSTTANTKWSFCAAAGKVFAFNTANETPWSFNGTTVTYYDSMPKASMCAMTVDRMLLSGVATEPNRLYFSQSGDLTNFTVDTEPEDPGFEDIGLAGEKITAIFATQSEWLIFKTNSFTSYQGTNQYDLTSSVISEKVGMSDPHAIVQHEGVVYFKSSDGKIWGYNSGTITELSKKIGNFVGDITKDAISSVLYSDKPHYDTGTYVGTSGESTPGSVEPDLYEYEDDLNADFNAGTVDVSMTVADDKIYLGSFGSNHKIGAYFDNIGGENGNKDNWTATSFTVATSYDSKTPTYGSYLFYTSGVQTGHTYLYLYKKSNNELVYSRTYDFIGTAWTNTITTIDMSDYEDTEYYAVFDCKASGTAATSEEFYKGTLNVNIRHKAITSGGITTKHCIFDIQENTPVASSGTFISQIHSVSEAKPHYGAFVNTSSKTTGATINFYVAGSSSATGQFSAWVATTSIDTSSDVYKWKAEVSVDATAIVSPYIDMAGLTFKTTGYWETPEVSMGGMSSWGTFSAGTTLTGSGSYSYKIYVSTYLGGTSNATAESITSGAVITASTGTYSKIRATNSLTASTETVRLNDISWRWNTASDKLSAAFEYLGDIYFSVPYNYNTSNNRLLKLDVTSSGWNVFDIPANSPLVIDNYVYFGSPSNSNIFQYPVGNNDNSAAINSYWKTKDFIGDNPYVDRKFQKLSIISGSDYGSSLDVTYTIDTATSTTYSVSLTSTTASFLRNNRQLSFGDSGSLFNLEVGNNAADQPWSFFGASVDYKNDSWIPTEE